MCQVYVKFTCDRDHICQYLIKGYNRGGMDGDIVESERFFMVWRGNILYPSPGEPGTMVRISRDLCSKGAYVYLGGGAIRQAQRSSSHRCGDQHERRRERNRYGFA